MGLSSLCQTRLNIKIYKRLKKLIETIPEAKEGIEKYMTFYNSERPHSWLNYGTPDMAYNNRITVRPTKIDEKCLKEAA